MLAIIPLHAEGARYSADLVFLPGLWSAPAVWRPAASYLAHRGWEGRIVGFGEVAGGLEARGAAVAAHLRQRSRPAVLVAHDAGAAVALHAASLRPVAAVVLVAPLDPTSPAVRTITRRWDVVAALLLGRALPPPAGAAAVRCYGSLPPEVASGLVPERADAVLDVVRGRVELARPGVPAALVSTEQDPLVPDPAGLACRLGADHLVLRSHGHWPLGGPGWRPAAAVLHRWLVRRLGEELLELHAEAMAERDADDDPSA